MSLRDWVGALAGASFAFLAALVAYSKHPEHAIKLLFLGSVALLAVLLLTMLIRTAWLSVWMENRGRREDGRLSVAFVLRIHGFGTMGTKVVNLLFPGSVEVEHVYVDDGPHSNPRRSSHANGEIVDSEEAYYWNVTLELLSDTVWDTRFAVSPGDRQQLPFVLNLLGKRKTFRLGVDEVGVRHTVEYAPIRAWLLARYMPIREKVVALAKKRGA